MRRPTPPYAVPLGSATVRRALRPNGKEDRPTMDGSSEQPQMTAGLDIGDKYSYLCLIDQESGQVSEEGRLRTTPEAFRRRFASEQPPMRIAIEAGTHSPWASRVLEGCGHEMLVANARKLRLIYSNKRKTDEVDAFRTWHAWQEWIRSCCTHSQALGPRVPGPHGHRPLARGTGEYSHAAGQPRP